MCKLSFKQYFIVYFLLSWIPLIPFFDYLARRFINTWNKLKNFTINTIYNKHEQYVKNDFALKIFWHWQPIFLSEEGGRHDISVMGQQKSIFYHFLSHIDKSH